MFVYSSHRRKSLFRMLMLMYTVYFRELQCASPLKFFSEKKFYCIFLILKKLVKNVNGRVFGLVSDYINWKK